MTTAPARKSDTDEMFGLVVNEARVMTYTAPGVADWWVSLRPRWEMSRQLRVLDSGFPGELVELGPFARDDAEFAHGHMIERGVPKAALKIRRWKSGTTPSGGAR